MACIAVTGCKPHASSWSWASISQNSRGMNGPRLSSKSIPYPLSSRRRRRRAAEELCRIWAYLTHGLTAKAQKYERTDPARDDARDIAIHLVQVHRRWRLSTRAAEQSVCQAVLFDGMGIAEAAKAYRKAAGWPRMAIGNCLGRWIELRGWA